MNLQGNSGKLTMENYGANKVKVKELNTQS